MSECYQRSYANVHRGIHTLSEQSTRMYEEARGKVRDFVKARFAHEIVFTSGTTSAINLVARSWGESHVSADDEILLTEMEHHSNIVPWQQLAERKGARVRFLPVTDDGHLDLEQLPQLLNERTKVLAVTAISNVLGTRNPIEQLTRLAHEAGAIIVVDGAQQAPHEPMDVQQWDADFVAISAHKMLGPSGIGALYGKESWLEQIPPFLGGGSMITTVTVDGFEPAPLPAKFEAGTPPIVEAIGFGAAIDYLNNFSMEKIADHEHVLVSKAHDRLQEIEGLKILGPGPDDKAGIVSFVVAGVNAQDISIFVDLEGVAIRAGHHCAMPLHDRFGVPSSCRASFYLYNTDDEVDRFVDILKVVVEKLR